MIELIQGKENLLADRAGDEIEIIRKKMEGFFDMKNVYFLFGSGTSCNAIPKMSALIGDVETYLNEHCDEKIQKAFNRIVNKKGRNLEEVLGVLYSKRSYLEGTVLNDTGTANLETTNNLIANIESVIFDKLNVGEDNADYAKVLDTYKTFYQKMALRNKDHSRICVFTTNNDLFNERALDSQNIHYINGFSGGLNRFFNPALFNYTMSKRMDTSIDKFEPIENMIYLYKIHGSINWVEDIGIQSNTFFKIRELSKPDNQEKTVLIYPTPLKQNKSLGSPYMDLFREFQHKLLEPNSVLFVIGYSFSDEHVNDIIYRALATNSTMNLVVFGNINEEREVCRISDNRIFRIRELDATGTPLHYFERIVDELLPDLDAFKQEDGLLKKFIQELDASRSLKKNEDR